MKLEISYKFVNNGVLMDSLEDTHKIKNFYLGNTCVVAYIKCDDINELLKEYNDYLDAYSVLCELANEEVIIKSSIIHYTEADTLKLVYYGRQIVEVHKFIGNLYDSIVAS